MEAQQAQAAQQTQSQSQSQWGSTPAPSSSTPNNSALPNPWGAIPAPQQSPFGTPHPHLVLSLHNAILSYSIPITYLIISDTVLSHPILYLRI